MIVKQDDKFKCWSSTGQKKDTTKECSGIELDALLLFIWETRQDKKQDRMIFIPSLEAVYIWSRAR